MRILAGVVAAVIAIVLAGRVARVVAPAPDLAVRAGDPAAAHPAAPLYGRGIRLRPVDPATLADRTDVPGLRFRSDGWTIVSPDGRHLAVTSGLQGPVTVIDVERWEPAATLEFAPSWGIEPVFAADGEALLWISGGVALVRQSLDGDLQEVELPVGMNPWAVVPLADRRAAVVGSTGHIVVVDFAVRALTADLQVDGLVIDAQTPDGLRQHFPGLAVDQAGALLYAAQRERVTVIDLAAGVVRATADLASGGTPLDSTRAASLSPDGTRLYVSGEGSDGNGAWVPIPVRVLDTATLTEVGLVDAPAGGQLQLAPDGRNLLTSDETGVAVLDPLTLRQRYRLDGAYLAGLSTDGRYAYVGEFDDQRLRVLDLQMQVFVAERELRDGEWLLAEAGVLVSQML